MQLCHLRERSKESHSQHLIEILRCAQNDKIEHKRGCVSSFDTPSLIFIVRILAAKSYYFWFSTQIRAFTNASIQGVTSSARRSSG